MQANFRFEKDHLQSIADQLCDAIACFYAGSSPDTVLNLTNGCKDKTHNLGTFYKKRGKIERIKFWSSREFANGQDSYSVSYARPTSNWTKHADTETETTRPIRKQFIAPQVLGAIVDFHQLKERLLKNGLAKTTHSKHFYKRWKGFSFNGIMDAADLFGHLRREFSIRTFDRAPKIDVASGLFIDWYAATAINDKSQIKALLENPPCTLPTGQLGPIARFALAANSNFHQLMQIAEYRIGKDEQKPLEHLITQQLKRETLARYSTPISMNLTLRLKGCHIGSRQRSEYYLDQVQGFSGEDLTGTIPNTDSTGLYILEPD